MHGMSIDVKSEIAAHSVSTSRFETQDMELTMKAVRGIADVEVGRCDSVAEVRSRVLSRYKPSRICV